MLNQRNFVWLALFSMPVLAWSQWAWAAQSNIEADVLTRDEKGVITAIGHVELSQKGKVLKAPTVTYDVPNNHLKAQGGVQVESDNQKLTADQVERDANGTITATGQVQLEQYSQVLNADQVVYDEQAGRVTAQGSVRVVDEDKQLSSDKLVRDAYGELTATGRVLMHRKGSQLQADQVSYSEQTGESNARGDVQIEREGATLKASQAWQQADGLIKVQDQVEINRDQELLTAERAEYDPKRKEMRATGGVHLSLPEAEIDAETMQLHTVNPTGEMEQVRILLPDDERIQSAKIRRLGLQKFEGEDIRFSACPEDDETWQLRADSAILDQAEGELIARNARFELVGVPLLYTPYWKQPLRRSSGLLIPSAGYSISRGTEVSVPYYFAPAQNWDATLTPRWMTARGLMGELEVRHAGGADSESVSWAQVRDKQTGTMRYRSQGELQLRLPANWSFSANGDYVSDRQYLAELEQDSELAKQSYLQSQAQLNWRQSQNYARLMVQNNQNLRLPNDKTTLQILPRFESGVLLPLDVADLHIDQQLTGFDRKLGMDGWRYMVHPWLEKDVSWFDGAVSTNWRGGMHHTQYWKMNTAQRGMSLNVYDVSVETRVELEKIAESGRLRHALTPVLRYDLASAPDQRLLPNFDSGFGRLTMSNLMSGNRFNGYDRFERMNRLSLLLENALQYKDEEGQARQVLMTHAGVAYDLLRQSVDPRLGAAATRPFSNLLGDVSFAPWSSVRLTASGIFNPVGNYWDTASAAMNWNPSAGNLLHVRWQRIDPRYATKSETIIGHAAVQLNSRWQVLAGAQYDAVDKLTQQASAGVHYQHACWDMEVTAYRTHLAGTAGRSDVGFSFLLGFKGLGSVGN